MATPWRAVKERVGMVTHLDSGVSSVLHSRWIPPELRWVRREFNNENNHTNKTIFIHQLYDTCCCDPTLTEFLNINPEPNPIPDSNANPKPNLKPNWNPNTTAEKKCFCTEGGKVLKWVWTRSERYFTGLVESPPHPYNPNLIWFSSNFSDH